MGLCIVCSDYYEGTRFTGDFDVVLGSKVSRLWTVLKLLSAHGSWDLTLKPRVSSYTDMLEVEGENR